MDKFVELLKKAMEDHDLGVNALAALSGVSGAHISRILNNQRSVPSPKTIKKLADALNINHNDLMEAAGHIDLYSVLSSTPEAINPIRETFIGYLEYLKTHHSEALIAEIMNNEKVTKEVAQGILNHIVDNFETLPIETQSSIFNNLISNIKVTDNEIKLSAKMPIPSDGIPLIGNHTVKLPVYGEVRAGVGGYALQEYLGTEQWIAKNGNCQECYMLKIKGESMYPRFFPGDYAVVKPQKDVDNGEVAIVILDNDEGVIKRIKKVPNGIILRSDNNLYPDREFYNEDVALVKIVGKVIDIKPGRV